MGDKVIYMTKKDFIKARIKQFLWLLEKSDIQDNSKCVKRLKQAIIKLQKLLKNNIETLDWKDLIKIK